METSARAGAGKKEVRKMVRTMADVHRDEGRAEGEKKGWKLALIRQLRTRFGELPPKIIQRINRTKETRQIETWLDRVLTAASLDDMGILPRE
jgi:hypothetical protein